MVCAKALFYLGDQFARFNFNELSLSLVVLERKQTGPTADEILSDELEAAELLARRR